MDINTDSDMESCIVINPRVISRISIAWHTDVNIEPFKYFKNEYKKETKTDFNRGLY